MSPTPHKTVEEGDNCAVNSGLDETVFLWGGKTLRPGGTAAMFSSRELPLEESLNRRRATTNIATMTGKKNRRRSGWISGDSNTNFTPMTVKPNGVIHGLTTGISIGIILLNADHTTSGSRTFDKTDFPNSENLSSRCPLLQRKAFV